MNPIKEIDHPARTVREVRVFVRQYIWPDGPSSYDVHLATPVPIYDGHTSDADRKMLDCLTDDSFDHMPSDKEIEQLSYIKPSVHREYPGVFYILSARYQKGPYPSRKAANADIRAGRW
jgi:hypothetical protein